FFQAEDGIRDKLVTGVQTCALPISLIGGHAHWLALRATESWPGWLLVPLTIVAMDGANWLAHYADHRLGPLWRFHALHHSQEERSEERRVGKECECRREADEA